MNLLLNEIQAATTKIAPSWPLDRLIAVNPFWGWREQSFEEASCNLSWLCGTSLNPEAPATGPRLPLLCDCLDESSRLERIDSISQICAAFFDQSQTVLAPSRQQGLFSFWRELTHFDPCFRRLCAPLSGPLQSCGPLQAVEYVLDQLQLPAARHYLTALLLNLNGWASCCAYQDWRAGLEGQPSDSVTQLLAILLCWEWSLRPHLAGSAEAWLQDLRSRLQDPPAPSQNWQQLSAQEREFQNSVSLQFCRHQVEPRRQTPSLQAVFCIDVRSEVLRRALERLDSSIQTIGFAGFFGLPAEYAALGSQNFRPQLPGLLKPQIQIEEHSPEGSSTLVSRRKALQWDTCWEELRALPLSCFHFVESLGLGYAWKLIQSTLGWRRGHNLELCGLKGQDKDSLRPRLTSLPTDKAVELSHSILRAMTLTDHFAPVVLLIGHCSNSCNNPQAAGLDCGACCGQSGEPNSRALAALLNDPQVRSGLARQGLNIPQQTRFIAGLHDTTSDEVALFEEQPGDPRIARWLREAADLARRERSGALSVPASSPARLLRLFRQRTCDWSQVRPEWGLANNAGLIVAPRARSAPADLQGRCFLHEYNWQQDSEGQILDQILAGPLVVAHWINMQYYASRLDPQRWGSGDKVLHNVVAGHLGVFEGSGGDLRIGLPLQSMHDGQQWRHQPLRLSVWVEAPEEHLQRAVSRNATVQSLVQGGWIHLLRIRPQDGSVSLWTGPGPK